MPAFKHAALKSLTGYVELAYDERGPGLGGYSRREVDGLRERSVDGAAVTNVERVRWILRTFHDGWDVPSEDELRMAAMAGDDW